MKIWLIKVGEPIPLEACFSERLHRTGLLSQIMADAGHKVVWWTSTFDRVTRKNIFEQDMVLSPREGLEIRLIHSPGYNKSISFARIRDYRIIAEKFRKLARQVEPPDIILCALPTIELCKSGVEYGRELGIPVVLDMRDMWPNIIVDSVPKIGRPVARLLLNSWFQDTCFSCSRATAITGITDEFVDWGLKNGNRTRT